MNHYITLGLIFVAGAVLGIAGHIFFVDDLSEHVRKEIFSECLALRSADLTAFGSDTGTDIIFIDECVRKAKNWSKE